MMESPKRKAKLRVGFGPVAGLLLIAAITTAALFTTFHRSSATVPPRDEHWFYHSSPERVDELFWEMVFALKPLTVEMLTSEDLTNEGLGSFDNTPSDKWLKAAERKYGDMPEYWQLRYMIEDYGRRTHTITVNQALERAVQAAPDDPVSYWLYAVEYSYGEMPAKDEETARRLRLCTELAPEQAFYYGELAVWLNRCGEIDAAMESIGEATAASKQIQIAPFPAGYVRYLRGKTPELSKHETQMLGAFLNCRLNGWLLWRTVIYDRDILRDALSRPGEAEDMSTMNILHQYACSYGLRDGADTIDMLRAVIFIMTLTDEVDKAGLWADNPKALKALKQMVELRKEFSAAAKDETTSLLGKYFNYDTEGMTSTPLQEGSAWLPQFEREIVAYELQPDPREPELRRLLREMAKFDYANPAAFVEEGASDKTGDDES